MHQILLIYYEKAIRHHIPLHPSPPQIFVWCQIEAIRHHTEFSWRGMWCRIASIWHHTKFLWRGMWCRIASIWRHTNFVGGGSGGKWGVVGGRWGAIPPRDPLPISWRMSDREPVKQVKTFSCIILKYEISLLNFQYDSFFTKTSYHYIFHCPVILTIYIYIL